MHKRWNETKPLHSKFNVNIEPPFSIFLSSAVRSLSVGRWKTVNLAQIIIQVNIHCQGESENEKKTSVKRWHLDRPVQTKPLCHLNDFSHHIQWPIFSWNSMGLDYFHSFSEKNDLKFSSDWLKLKLFFKKRLKLNILEKNWLFLI